MMIAIVFVLFFGLVATWLVAPQDSRAKAVAPAPEPIFVLSESAA